MMTHHESLQEDPDAYRVIAETLARTGVFGLPVDAGEARPTAFRPPLYPWLLAWLVDGSGRLSNLSVAVLHCILGGLTIGLTWDIARRLLSKRAAWIAAALVAIDPILLWQSTLVMTETIATALVMLAWWWWVARICRARVLPVGSMTVSPPRRYVFDAAILGVLLTLCIFCRPTFLVWAGMIAASLPRTGPVHRGGGTAALAITLAVVALGVGAWALRNTAAIGHPVWGTTHGGYTLLLANNESFYDYLENRAAEPPWRRPVWQSDEFFAEYRALPRSGDEWADDRITYAAAKETIQGRPSMFWYSCWVRMTRLWQPFPHAAADRSTASIVVVGFFYSFVYALVLIAILRHASHFHPRHWRQWVAWWPAAALVITLSGVHAVYWSNPRMRSPAIPAMSIIAAAAFTRRRD